MFDACQLIVHQSKFERSGSCYNFYPLKMGWGNSTLYPLIGVGKINSNFQIWT